MPQNAAAALWISTSGMPIKPGCLLLVDDDRTMRTMMQESLQKKGYDVHAAKDGSDAFTMLMNPDSQFDALVLDSEMPTMPGLQLVEKMKKIPHLSTIPIIMLTGSSEAQKIQKSIDAGVYYYLVKPVENAVLYSIIESALRERRQQVSLIAELRRHDGAIKAMRQCQLQISTLIEAEDSACFLASCFPDPERVVAGLMELLVNAVEHGNLGISYDRKTELLATNQWREELARLAALPENKDKKVDIVYQHKEAAYLVQITDSGPGFDWKRYWHINPARATASHGRGIARARLMAFDRLSYNEHGNSVTVMVLPSSSSSESYAW